MNKLESLNRKAGWVVALAAVLLFVFQQQQLNQSRSNERAAHESEARLLLENHALRQVVIGQRVLDEIEAQSASWAAPFLRPLSGGAK